MTPDMAHFSGHVHGGTVLKFLDQVAYACAGRYAGRSVVTLSVDQGMAENICAQALRHANSCFFKRQKDCQSIRCLMANCGHSS